MDVEELLRLLRDVNAAPIPASTEMGERVRLGARFADTWDAWIRAESQGLD